MSTYAPELEPLAQKLRDNFDSLSVGCLIQDPKNMYEVHAFADNLADLVIPHHMEIPEGLARVQMPEGFMIEKSSFPNECVTEGGYRVDENGGIWLRQNDIANLVITLFFPHIPLIGTNDEFSVPQAQELEQEVHAEITTCIQRVTDRTFASVLETAREDRKAANQFLNDLVAFFQKHPSQLPADFVLLDQFPIDTGIGFESDLFAEDEDGHIVIDPTSIRNTAIDLFNLPTIKGVRMGG